MQSILIVDDDDELLNLLRDFLQRHGYSVETARSGVDMDERMQARSFDLLILDVMLPGEDGLSLCRRTRARSGISIIMLTAVTETTDRIIGLELGADDYLSKPFDARELLARIRALLRRSSPAASLPGPANPCLVFGPWRLDLAKRELRADDGTQVPLSSGEFELLLVFLEHPRRLLTREQLIDYARGPAHDVFDRSIDVQISRIRRKIEADARNPELIRTVRNAGYLFTHPVERLG